MIRANNSPHKHSQYSNRNKTTEINSLDTRLPTAENNKIQTVASDITQKISTSLSSLNSSISGLQTSDTGQTTAINNLTTSLNDFTNKKQNLIHGSNLLSSEFVS
jgi:hypothetical protein